MAQFISLKSADDHAFDAYLSEPQGTPKAGLVVLQEIFGVNSHIRAVVDGFAQDGYLALAPALFDRAERHVDLHPGPDTGKQGVALMQRIPLEQTLADIETAISYLRTHGMRKVGVVGYCWGGLLAWLANTRLHPDATVSYYAGRIQNFAAETPSCPAMFHFGLLDQHIPQTVVEELRQKQPQAIIYTYEADHAFNNDLRPSYNPAAAALARARTLQHFEQYL